MRRLIALLLACLLALPAAAFAEADAVETLSAFVQSALDRSEELHYEFYEEYPTFELYFQPEDDRLGALYAYLDIYDHGILIQTAYEQPAPADRLGELARFMAMVNGDLLGGKYCLYQESGAIVYEYFLVFDLFRPAALDQDAQEALLGYLFSALDEADYDVEYFMEIFGGETAENAYAMYLADLGYYE